MERSLYPVAVPVTAEDLQYTESTKSEAIKKIITTLGTTGPVSGLVVNIGTIPTKVKISSGMGYTFGGEYCSIETERDNITITNTINVKNYICLKITEDTTYNSINVITGDVVPTRVTQTVIPAVYTENDWANVNSNERNLCCLLAVVTGSGGNIKYSDIRRASVATKSILYVYNQPSALTGVSVTTVSSNTPLGNGNLLWNYSGQTMQWQVFGSGSYGTSVKIGINGIYTLFSHDGASYIKVDITRGELPLVNTSEAINVVDIFGQYELTLGTMNDNLHRSLMGQGIPSPKNPHGQTLDDFDPGIVQDMLAHTTYFHSGGIVGGTPGDSSCVASFNGDKTSTTSLIVNPIIGDAFVISNGIRIGQIPNTVIDFNGSETGIYYVYVDGDGSLSKSVNRPSTNFLTICKVYWNHSNHFNSDNSALIDMRVWGSVSPKDKVHADDDTVIKAADTISYSLSDNLGKLRCMIKAISGGIDWITTPDSSIKAIKSAADVLSTTVGTLSTNFEVHDKKGATEEPHGLIMGENGNIDAKMLGGYSPSKVKAPNKVIVSNENGKINTDFLATGHNPDPASQGILTGIDADKLDGVHLFEIQETIEQMTDGGNKLRFYLSENTYYSQDTATSAPRTIKSGQTLFISRVNKNGDIVEQYVVPANLDFTPKGCFSSCFSSCNCECGSLCRW